MATDSDKTYSQEHRQIQIVSGPLDDDVLLPFRLNGYEAISKPFKFDIEMFSTDPEIAFIDVVGKPLTLKLKIPNAGDNAWRYFNGLITDFQVAGMSTTGLHLYKATLEPFTWILQQRKNCRIFQDMSVIDIFKAVCGATNLAKYKIELNEEPGKREYCVQYQESDFDFINRLFEDEGIYYYFEYEEDKHVMVVVDNKNAHETCADGEADVDSWEFHIRPAFEAYKHRDYDWGRPNTTLEGAAGAAGDLKLEIYDYPGGFPGEEDDGSAVAIKRYDELTAMRQVVHASTSEMRSIQAGYKFAMAEHQRSDQNIEYLVLEAEIHIEGENYDGGGAELQQELEYKCEFVAIPGEQEYRPPRDTPAPQITGPQSAVVVGPSGEEIHTDEHGRIKIKFHWDRDTEGDENSSCWVRVVQPWAGNGFGAMFHPRIGHEVVVAFMNGSLDEPVVIGSLYNGLNAPPYDPVEKKTVTCIKTKSGDGEKQSNEIRFKDTTDDEQLYMHAAKVMDLRSEDSMYHTVLNELHVTVEKNKLEQIKEDFHETIGKGILMSVGETREVNVGGDDLVDVTGDAELTAGGDIGLSGTKVVVEGAASGSIELKVGSSSIKIEAAKITIKSTQIAIEGTGTAEMKAATVTLNGSAMAEVKGAMVKIN